MVNLVSMYFKTRASPLGMGTEIKDVFFEKPKNEYKHMVNWVSMCFKTRAAPLGMDTEMKTSLDKPKNEYKNIW